MKKMKVGDYILTKDIPNQETLDRIRACVKKMGYNVSCFYGNKFKKHSLCDYLRLYSDGDLVFTTSVDDDSNRYTPQEIFAMVEEPDMKEDIKQTIQYMKDNMQRMKKSIQHTEEDIVKLEGQLKGTTYKRGDRFYIQDAFDEIGEYILALVEQDDDGYHMCLVELSGGDRWLEPLVVGDGYAVTHAEMLKLTDGTPYKLIEK